MKVQEHIGIDVNATKGSLQFLKWLIPLILGSGLLGGGIAQDSKLDGRISSLESIVQSNTIELNGSKIELKNFTMQIEELREDAKATRSDVKQILIILTKRP
jgi:hypothetical protein